MTEEKPKAGLCGAGELGLDFLGTYPSPLYAHFLFASLLPPRLPPRPFLEALVCFPVYISFPFIPLFTKPASGSLAVSQDEWSLA